MEDGHGSQSGQPGVASAFRRGRHPRLCAGAPPGGRAGDSWGERFPRSVRRRVVGGSSGPAGLRAFRHRISGRVRPARSRRSPALSRAHCELRRGLPPSGSGGSRWIRRRNLASRNAGILAVSDIPTMSDTGLILRPSWRFLLRHPAHFIAFGGGVGLAPVAPGTFGTLLALPLHSLIAPRLAPYEYLLLVVALFALGVWACDVTGRATGVADHGGMVWDEVVAFLLVLFFVPATLSWQVAAFLLFRAF